MADHSLTTNISRRTMLAGGTAAIASPAAFLSPATVIAAPGGTGDARIAALAAEYQCINDVLSRLTDVAERRHGLFAYEGPPYCDRYYALVNRADCVTTLLAQTRPDGLTGLALKVNAAFFEQEIRETLDCDQRILAPALRDLLRMAECHPGALCW